MKHTKKQINEAYEHLSVMYGFEQTHETYAQVTHVSKSGMLRYIKLYILENNRLYNISYHTALLIGESYNPDKGFKVTGCGMDMIYHAISRLNETMITMRYPNDLERQRDIIINKRGSQNYFVDTHYYQL